MPKRSLADLVLDTIDIISARKNRPNLFRIYRHLHRLYDLSLQTCEQLIQTLLIEGKVIRVTYKGNISYRNALKWKKYSYYMKKNMGSELPGSLLTNAISELVVEEPDYLHIGVPYNILENHLLSMEGINVNKETIQNVLQRELKLESLQQYDNGNYFLGPKPPEAFLFEKVEINPRLEKLNSEIVKIPSSESLYNVINREESGICSAHSPEKDITFNVIHNNNNNNNNNKGENAFNRENNSVYVEPSLDDKIESVDSESFSESDNIQSSQSDISVVNGLVEESSSQDVTNDKNYHKANGPSQDIDLEELPQDSCPSHNDINQIDNSNSATSDTICNTSEMDVASVSSGGEDNTDKISEHKLESSDEIENDFSNANSPDQADSKSNSSSTPVKEYEDKQPVNSLILERGKRKKKTNYDESFYYFPSLKRKCKDPEVGRKKTKKKKPNEMAFSSNNNTCCECQSNESRSIENLDPMIYCSSCSNEGHVSCALRVMKGKKEWTCLNCRQNSFCKICKGTTHESHRGYMYKCSQCSDHYHKECHKPTITLPVSNSWQCWACLPSKSSEYFEGDPPDSSSWTSQDVFEYFKNHFEEEIAKHFQKQDIDGEVLGLMNESDVLRLNFNLGTRLKILMHIRRLQLRTNNLTDLWNS